MNNTSIHRLVTSNQSIQSLYVNIEIKKIKIFQINPTRFETSFPIFSHIVIDVERETGIVAGAIGGVVEMKRSGVRFSIYLCWETVWIEGQVTMPFQVGSRHGQEWHQVVCV